ncbi:MAG: NADH-quinone oxidoreductase subunit N, partial [Gemmataceae bacterium]
LFARLFPRLDRVHLAPIALFAVAAAAAIALLQVLAFSATVTGAPAFDQLLKLDAFSGFLRLFLLLAALAVLWLSRLTGLPDAADSADFSTLLLGGLLGMMLMVSANHWLMVFLAIEMASVPGYALAAFRKGDGRASEAALKYVLFGAVSSGIMLFGISTLAGRFGSGNFSVVAQGLAATIQTTGWDALLVQSVVFVLAGLAYKLAVVPMHFWLPDVFEGALAEVAALLALASKAAAVGLLARILISWQSAIYYDPTLYAPTIGLGLGIVAMVTMTYANLVAYPQQNLQRLLAYSTIAHAGMMLAGLSLMTPAGVRAVLVYLMAYFPATIGLFSIVALLRNVAGVSQVAQLRGLLLRSPVLGLGLCVGVVSLLGLPPLVGFAGKFAIFQELYRSAAPGAQLFFGVALFNTALSAGYYLNLVRMVGLEEPPGDEKGNPQPLHVSVLGQGFVVLMMLLMLTFGVWWGPLLQQAEQATGAFPMVRLVK